MNRKIDDRSRDILAAADIDGRAVRLTGQLDRAEYVRVNKVLEALGGKWNRRAAAHVFQSDPREALAGVLGGAAIPRSVRATEGYVATPGDLAADILSAHTRIPLLPPGAVVLEPSAGDGVFVRAVRNANRRVRVHAVEPNEDRAKLLAADSAVTVWTTTFERFTESVARHYDAVVMNPPFALPGEPTAWIDHVNMAWRLLAPGARLVAIVPAGYSHRSDRRHAAMRELIAEHGGYEELPAKAFAASGTTVSTVLVWADRPGGVS